MKLPHLATPELPVIEQRSGEHELAAKHMPVLLLDSNEPTRPLVLGYHFYRQVGPSVSSKFRIAPPEEGTVIEYAIWYDWDIQHLYDLEHIWVHLDAKGEPVRVEGSMHGLRVSMDTGTGLPEMRGNQPILYVEPGKHALWVTDYPMRFIARRMIDRVCGLDAGAQGIHMGNIFAANGGYKATERDHDLAMQIMKRAAFKPTYDFSRSSEDYPPTLVPWPALADWIPQRMKALIAALENVDWEQAAQLDAIHAKEMR